MISLPAAISPPLLAVFGSYLPRCIKFAAVNAGAFVCGCIPAMGTGKVGGPKGPGSALFRPDGINRANLTFPAAVKKYAVPRAGIFNDCRAQTHTLEEPFFQLCHWYIQVSGDESNFGPAYPDIALGRPGAAPAALQALKMQARGIPLVFTIIHGIYLTKKTHSVNYEFKIENLELRKMCWFTCAIRLCEP